MAAVSPGRTPDATNPAPPPGDAGEAWQQIAGLKLRLGHPVHLYRHRYRGEPWLIIADRESETYYRCSHGAERFLGLLDGSRSVEEAYREAGGAASAGLQPQDVLLLIANLKAAGLLRSEIETGQHVDAPARAATSPWLRPFAIRIPLFDPDRLLAKTAHLYRPLFSRAALILWSIPVLLALAAAWLHWPGLLEHAEARFADPKNLLWYWLLYPVVKALHELGHACATRAWGGAVRETGIMLLVLFPVPYVDSSAAHGFGSKRRRMAVSAAGIMVELLLASLALLLWVNTDHGLLRDLAFDVIVIGGLSTLIFNANPLLRFDGYYILGELVEIPNLGTRAQQYLAYLFRHYLLAMPGQRSPVTGAGEAGWLAGYGICAFAYRIFISLFIAFWVAGKFLIIGVLLAFWAVATQLAYPAVRGVLRLIPEVARAGRLRRLGFVASVAAVAILAGLVAPVGHSSYAEGVVSLPEDAMLRAGADGIVAEVLLADGAAVARDETVLRLENPVLAARRDVLLAQLEETRARRDESLLRDRSRADILKLKVSAIEADLGDVQAQLENLQVASKTSGLLSLPFASDLPGRYLKKGEQIGFVAGPEPVSALVAIAQADIDVVRRNTEAIVVKFSSRPARVFEARLLRELPGGTNRLPSRVLGSAAGGQVAVDARDETGLRVLSNVFLLEIALPPEIPVNYPGQRVHVRFLHPRASLGQRILRGFSQLMLQAPFVRVPQQASSGSANSRGSR